MTNLNLKMFIYCLATIAVGVLLITWLIGHDFSNMTSWLRLVSYVATTYTIVVFIFAKWAWKHPFFAGWLVPCPDLSGTWLGYIHSDYKQKKSDPPLPPIPAMLTISQSFLHINCRMKTTDRTTSSFGEALECNPDQQINRLSYLYDSVTDITNPKNTVHTGAVVYDISQSPDRKLSGAYWTTNTPPTRGNIELDFHCKGLLDNIPQNHFVIENPVT